MGICAAKQGSSRPAGIPASILSGFKKNYKLSKELGEGAMSKVVVGTRIDTGEQFAVKVVDASMMAEEGGTMNIFKEVEVWERLDHEHVVKLYECYYEDGKLYLVTELMTGGELFDAIVNRESYTEEWAQKVARDVCEAIQHCHANHVVHRDLKPENLLLASKEEGAPVKLADFGFAAAMKPTEWLQQMLGTPGYVAPEILNGLNYGREVDMWSFGVVLYILLCGYPPFYDDDQDEMFRMIRTVSYEFDPKEWDDVSDTAKDLIMKLFTRDQEARLTAAQVLEHPWMTRAAPTKEISVPRKMREFNAKMKWKALKHATRAANVLRATGVQLALTRAREEALSGKRNEHYETPKTPPAVTDRKASLAA
jgi:calcium/calmodulin-dependent protein kinase I